MKKKNTQKYISNLEKKISNKKKGLPEDIFLFTSRITPLINVDLLIKDKKLGTLLTWRNKGEKYPAGWHVPGGIIRFKEKIYNRTSLRSSVDLATVANTVRFLLSDKASAITGTTVHVDAGTI